MGKTTLTYNIAYALASHNKRVLLVDSDPQCNLSAYLIDGDVLDDILDHSDDVDGKTIWSAVKPVVELTGPIREPVPLELHGRDIFLMPGDIRLSDFEADLNNFWAECLQRKVRGFTGTTALSQLVGNICDRHNIDFVFYDSGPNIGPLNRVILLDCDFFIVPVACDLFSVRALKTLGRTLAAWISEWQIITDLAPTDTYLLPGQPEFLGYIPQNFSLYRGGVAAGPAKYLSMIDRSIHTDVVGVLRKVVSIRASGSFRLGEVKDFGVLIAASQREGKPLQEVGNASQRATARAAFDGIARKIIERTS